MTVSTATLVLLLLTLVGADGQDIPCSIGEECISKETCPGFQDLQAEWRGATRGSDKYTELLNRLKGKICQRTTKFVCCSLSCLRLDVDNNVALRTQLKISAPPSTSLWHCWGCAVHSWRRDFEAWCISLGCVGWYHKAPYNEYKWDSEKRSNNTLGMWRDSYQPPVGPYCSPLPGQKTEA